MPVRFVKKRHFGTVDLFVIHKVRIGSEIRVKAILFRKQRFLHKIVQINQKRISRKSGKRLIRTVGETGRPQR